jgi:choline dehydrogenase-like flavoprotein
MTKILRVAVVGSGPGGSVTATHLAEAGFETTLFEEGSHLPLESCEPFSLDEMIQKYRQGGLTVALGPTKVSYVEGRCVGGGSEINSALYHRTPPEILEAWRKDFAVEGIADSDLRPHFEACERDVSVSPLPCPAPASSLKLAEGARKLGWKSMEVPRWFRYVQENGVWRGTRQSMTETFIPRFLAASGTLRADTRVRRIRRQGSGWALETPAGEFRAETVFVCGGAVHTPALLLRSGRGRNVGRSLRMHPTVKFTARFPEAINSEDMGVPVHQVKEFAPQISFGCSISSPAHLALALTANREDMIRVREDWTRMATYYSMIATGSQGRVALVPGSEAPWVTYRVTQDDLKLLGQGLQRLGRLLFAAGADRLWPSIEGATGLSEEAALSFDGGLPRGLTQLMTIHLFSSCPMGENTSNCATDSYGRVHGETGLYINDASLLCTALGVNPQGTIMAFARRNVLRFIAENR